MPTLSTGWLAVMLIASLTASVAHADDKANPYSRDLKILSAWFEGEFDNAEQEWFELDPRSATPKERLSTRLHTLHRRLDAPQFGEHVFYVEEYKDANPEDVIRQRLVIFSTHADGSGIRMQQGFFKDASKVLGAYDDTSKLANLGTADVVFLDNCDVTWQRSAEQFVGRMAVKQCVFGEGADRRYSVHDLILGSNKYWRIDSTYRVSDDSFFVGNRPDQPSKMRRVKPFICDVYFYGDKPGEAQVVTAQRLHSQGGLIRVSRDSDGAEFEVLMRDKEYPYYETRPDFIYLSIRPAGQRRSIAFSVNDPASRQLGLRTQELGAFCHRDGYAFREPVTDFSHP